MVKKRIASVMLALCLLLTMLPITALAANSGNCGPNVHWTLDNGLLTISGTGEMENYTYATAPWYQRVISSVVIEKDVTSIGDWAFYKCTGLKSVIIPDSVTGIGKGTFEGCSGLTSVTIPSSVTSIGKGAFKDCNKLTGAAIPGGVTRIEDETFYSCSGLTSVTIPDSVNYIGDSAFDGCSGLTSVTIPDGVTIINYQTFRLCSGLTSVEIPDSVVIIGQKAFYGCLGLTSVDIPDSVTGIDSQAFQGCSGLESVDIPDGVTSIEYRAFKDCIGLTSVTIPDKVTSIENFAFEGCSGLESVDIPGSVESIGNGAFAGCSGLESVDIPYGVTSISYRTFNGCSGLKSVTIPDSVTSIENAAFQGCSGLTSVTIPNSVTSIGDLGFCDCIGLTSVTIPDSVTSIGSRAFADCSGLKSVTISSSVTSIGNAVFDGCSGLTSVDIPDSVTSIESFAFEGCIGLKSVTIPSSVTSIGSRAFADCSGLTSVTIPSTVASIGNSAFEGCSGLTDVYYGGSEEEWKAISVGELNDKLKNAAIHYNYNSFTITFDPQGGSVTPESATTDGSGKLSELPIPTIGKDCFKFEGWHESNDFNDTYAISMDTVFDRDTIVYAKWNEEHSPQTVSGKDATCVDEGLTDSVECSVCGTVLEAPTVIPATGVHTLTVKSEDIQTAATCTNAGLKTVTYECSVCKQESKQEENIDPPGHKEEVIPAVKVTCTTDGSTAGKKCSVCDEILEQPRDIAAHHAWGKWIIKKEPTDTENGSKERVCAVCGETDTAEISVNGGTTTPGGDDNPGGTTTPGGDDNPGGTTTPGGNDNPGGTTTPGGNDNPGGTTTPGGDDNPGGTTTPGGDDNPGGTTTPGGNDNPGGTTTPGGDDNPGGTTTPGGDDNPGGTTTPGGDDNPGGTTTPGGDDNPGIPSTPTATSYRIYTLGSTPGGSYYVSHGSAAQGTRVTVGLSPWRDYALDRLLVTNLDTGASVSLTREYSDRYTFIMPASNVEVEISFVNIYTASTYYFDVPSRAKPGPTAWYYRDRHIYHVTDGMVPDNTLITRDMFLSVLYNLTDDRLISIESQGSETNAAQVWATNNGILPDIYDSGLWGLDKALTREQTAMLVFNYARYRGYQTSQTWNLTRYADYNQVRSIARIPMSWVLAANLLDNTATISPQSTLSCGQAGGLLYRFETTIAR